MDEFRDEVNKIKDAPLKERIAYYTYYYKWHVISVVVGVWIISSLVYSSLTSKEVAFCAFLINALQVEEGKGELETRLIEGTAIDLDKESLLLDATIYMDYAVQDMNFISYQQKLSVMMGASEIDMVITDYTTFSNLCMSEMFLDLQTLMTEEEIAMYEPYFYYIDAQYFAQRDALLSSGEISYEFPEYNAREKEGMAEPMAIGIVLSEDSPLLEEYAFIEKDVVAGVVVNSRRLDRTQYFLDMLLESNE
ncbi:MAG: hypothetical protein R3Y54_02970 [Eubacteriales bacterium]